MTTKKQHDARATLRQLFDGRERKTVYTILRHVSSSGMSRDISLKMVGDNGELLDITYLSAKATGDTCRDRHGQNVIRVKGCGMDMGFHLVSGLSWTLYNGHDDRPDYVLSHEWA
jgi:hypothetical protein